MSTGAELTFIGEVLLKCICKVRYVFYRYSVGGSLWLRSHRWYTISKMVMDPSHNYRVPCSLTEVAIVKALLGCMAVHSFRPYSEMFAAFAYT